MIDQQQNLQSKWGTCMKSQCILLLLNDFLQLQPGHWNRLPHVSLGQGHSYQIILQIIKTLQRSQHIATYQQSKTTVIEGKAKPKHLWILTTQHIFVDSHITKPTSNKQFVFCWGPKLFLKITYIKKIVMNDNDMTGFYWMTEKHHFTPK